MTLGLAEIVNYVGRSFYELISDRRVRSRVEVAGTVRASYYDYTGWTTTAWDCLDYSPHGMGIRCLHEIPENLEVCLYLENRQPRLARVTYCRPINNAFRVGLVFQSVDTLR